MTKEQKKILESLVFVAQLRTARSQAYVIKGDYNQKKKQQYEIMLNHINKFLDIIENSLDENQLEFLDEMEDFYHDATSEIKKNLEVK